MLQAPGGDCTLFTLLLLFTVTVHNPLLPWGVIYINWSVHLVTSMYRADSDLALSVEQGINGVVDRWSCGDGDVSRRMNVNCTFTCIEQFNFRQTYKPLMTPVWQQFYSHRDWLSLTPPTSRLSHCLPRTMSATDSGCGGMFLRSSRRCW